jgi:hypothetical protein
MGGNRPTVSQAEAWQPDSLRAAADAWDAASTDIAREFDVIVQGVQASEDFWLGDSADAARTRTYDAVGDADQLARALVAASVAARVGADRIAAAKHDVVSLVQAMRELNFGVADDGTVTPPELPPSPFMSNIALAPHLTRKAAERTTEEIRQKLDALGAADADAARQIEAAFRDVVSPVTHAASNVVPPADWPTTSQGGIAAQIAGLSDAQRKQLIRDYPQYVGNTDGVPWDMRIAANRVNIEQAIVDERRNLAQASGNDREAIQQRITFYEGLLKRVPDPTGRRGPVDRQVLAFDPQRASFIELIGDLDTAKGVGVLIPGMNTTILGSAENTKTATQFVNESRGDLAMITFLGGPFPQGLKEAADSRSALDMAPRLVAFSQDVDRVVDATGRYIPVTYLGHSYGGSILGTAEASGLTADRIVFVEAAGAGVEVWDPSDWHDTNPDVMRFSMTAPGDPIEYVQGIPYGPHGADPDEMPGVIRLATGNYDDGRPVAGEEAHGDILNEKSEAWRNLLAVMTHQPYTYLEEVPVPSIPFPPTVLPFLRWVS